MVRFDLEPERQEEGYLLTDPRSRVEENVVLTFTDRVGKKWYVKVRYNYLTNQVSEPL